MLDVFFKRLYVLNRGNVLLTRKEPAALQFILEGKKLLVKTFGLVTSIIDFTLSRMNTGKRLYTYFHIMAQILQRLIQQKFDASTGEDILFLDLSSDPALFEGPKGDKQVRKQVKLVCFWSDFMIKSFIIINAGRYL